LNDNSIVNLVHDFVFLLTLLFYYFYSLKVMLADADGENLDSSADLSTKVRNDPNDPDYLDEDTISRLKKEGGKVSFEEMGKIIGQRWKNIDPDRLQKFSELAAEDTDRYKKEMQAYNSQQEERMRAEAIKNPQPTYTEMHMKNSSVPSTSSYSDPSMGYGAAASGGYYAYPEAYQYPTTAMYSYSYPSDAMQQQQQQQQQQMGGPSDQRSQHQQYSQYPSNYYGVPPGYPMGYG
jgi:hypothetical protein